MRAQDLDALRRSVRTARDGAPALRLIIDSTIATPWAFRTPLLDQGVDVVLASGTKALGGTDRDLWGYVATNDIAARQRASWTCWRCAAASSTGGAPPPSCASWDDAERRARAAIGDRVAGRGVPRRASARSRGVPPVAAVASRRRGDRARITSGTARCCRSASTAPTKSATRHFADVLATTRRSCATHCRSTGSPPRSTTTRPCPNTSRAPAQLQRNGFDRLIRLGVGLEDADDLIAALNWTLHHGDAVTADDLDAWQRERAAQLGMATGVSA